MGLQSNLKKQRTDRRAALQNWAPDGVDVYFDNGRWRDYKMLWCQKIARKLLEWWFGVQFPVYNDTENPNGPV